MNKVVLLLGGNMGNRSELIRDSLLEISKLGNIVSKSEIYESEAWGFESENNFLNICIELETEKDALEILKLTQAIEVQTGRKKQSNAYASRKMDIDILFYNSEIIKTENLIIPHPRLHERMFTLICLMDIVPNFNHPVLEKSIKELLNECNDTVKVWQYKND
ncbi:MAG: 2-amino-4-hydroxy-6-hydroxymethyldihydropteridine diphosphokinase [Bacteroidetes bacterium]|nr:MAG: 2-amino-4-hydroxy-6-hydroxymethyldihydropteridine diphosphokinase [Bacteroidota bacterium]